MSLLHLFLLSLVQGITEFLPISSSGHLILVPALFQWPDQGLLIDVAVHVGTLAAVMIYFRRDVVGLFYAPFSIAGLGWARSKENVEHYEHLLKLLILATIPVVIVGFILSHYGLTSVLRNGTVIGLTSIIFGLLLYYFDTRSAQHRDLTSIGVKDAIWIGLSQILALIPGTSRSGITMTMARGRGFRRTEAARFSMLLAMPTIIAAGLLGALEIAESGDITLWRYAFIAAGMSFVAAILAIHFFMRWLQNASMTIFVVYRVLLGVGLLAWIYL